MCLKIALHDVSNVLQNLCKTEFDFQLKSSVNYLIQFYFMKEKRLDVDLNDFYALVINSVFHKIKSCWISDFFEATYDI